MMIAFKCLIRSGLAQSGLAAPAIIARHAARFAFPFGVLCWFEIGGPRTTNSTCMAIGAPAPHCHFLFQTANTSYPDAVGGTIQPYTRGAACAGSHSSV